MQRRQFLSTALGLPAAILLSRPSLAATTGADRFTPILDRADGLESLRTVIVSVDGRTIAERGYHGRTTRQATNIKSASKSIISALVGIAIDRKILSSVDQPIAPLLKADMPASPDPRLQSVTIGNLLSMQAGLGRMSGPNYGRWVSSRNWVRFALAEPFDGDPGGGMLYSTANTHLLSAILTRVTKRPTLALAQEWLGPLDGFSIASWERDPQGIYLGGNQMAMTPRSLLAFGELYRLGGVTPEGMRLISQSWIDQSWRLKAHSVFSGDGYGYCWFFRNIGGEEVKFAWGFGGQMLYIVPSLKLTVVMTSDENNPSARTGYRDALHNLLGEIIIAIKAAG